MERHRTIPIARTRDRAFTEIPGAVGYEEAAVARDRVRWGPIWAGLVTAISSFILLHLLFYAFGLMTVNWNTAEWTTLAQTQGWVSAIVGLIAFFLGGMVTGASTLVRGSGAGALNGFLVWATAMVLILLMSALGLGFAFGAAGEAFSRFALLGRGQLDVATLNATQVSGWVREGALWSFLFMLLAAGAAAAGAAITAQGEPVGEVPPETETHTDAAP